MPISPRFMTGTLSALAAVGALALLGSARPAAAQNISIPTGENAPVATVRAGAFFPFNSQMKNNVGKTFYGAGLDYIIHQDPGQSRTELSVDYIERSSGGNTARIIPVTIGQFTLHTSNNGIRPYLGIGAGAYFIHQSGPNDAGTRESQDKAALGGYFGAGLDFPNNLMIEARYHLIQKVGLYNSSGLQIMAGIRF